LELPYLMASNYLTTLGALGAIDLVVLNELRAPETCKSSVEILMYISAGDDFEFQCPTSMQGDSIHSMLPFSGQANREVLNSVVAAFPHKTVNLDYSASSIGEICMSIKQLLARNNSIYQTTLVQDTNSVNLCIWPWLASAVYESSTGVAGPNAGGDLYSYLSPMYAFFKGPVRIKFGGTSNATINPGTTMEAMNLPAVYSSSTNVISAAARFKASNASLGTVWFANSMASANGLKGAASSSLQNCEGPTAWMVPYYCQTKFSAVLRQTTSDHMPQDMGSAITSQPQSVLCITQQENQTTARYWLERSFPEDFQLAYFIGCPPVYISST